MEAVIVILILSVFIRRFIPAKGFLCDEQIERLTYFGEARNIELRDITGVDADSLVTLKKPTVPLGHQPVQREQPMPKVQKPYQSEGVDLGDIKAKQSKEVDTDYMFSNIDDSDEDLTSVIKKSMQR